MTARRRICTHALPALLVLAAALPGRALAGSGSAQLPDLSPWRPTEVQVGTPDDPALGSRALRFGTPTQNLGAFPLEILGTPRGADLSAGGQQCIAWTARACSGYRDAAPLVWHDAHSHWHFPSFATYELRPLSNGLPDMSGPPVAGGTKTSSCIRDDYYDAEHSPDPANRVPFYYQACTLVRQGITPSWVDYYPADLEGQQILLNGVPNGTYALVVQIDPDDLLAESDETNNTAFLPIEIAGNQVIVLL